MDPSRTEPMTEARLSVYRTAMKVRSLQRFCHMDAVLIQHIAAASQLVGGANPRRDAMLNRESVAAVLNRMFNCASQEVTVAASEETGSLLFRLLDREGTGQVSARSLQTTLVALSADSVLAKYRSLVHLSGDGSGSVTRSALSSLLQDLSKVPAAVQEQEVFGSVEEAVTSCFNQPTWKESLSSLVHNARHALLPRRHTNREADRTSILTWAEPAETQNRAPLTSDGATPSAASARSSSCDEEEARDAAVQASPPLSSSKSLQTDEAPPPQQVRQLQGLALLTEVRNLQRDKWLLEQQVGAWRLTVQSEQGILEDRCSEMEVTMATMRQHNERLQDMLNQALRKMEAQQHANNMDHTEGGTATPTSDPPTDDEEEEELMKNGDEWSLNETQTPSPTILRKSSPSHDEQEVEMPEDCQPIGRQESLKDLQPIGRQESLKDLQPIGQQGDPEEAGLQTNVPHLSDAEDPGTCSPEVFLQQTVDRLKTEMDRRRDRNTGESVRAELAAAAEQVGDAVSRLVDASVLLPAPPLTAAPPLAPPPTGCREGVACGAEELPAGCCSSEPLPPGWRGRGLNPGPSLGWMGAWPATPLSLSGRSPRNPSCPPDGVCSRICTEPAHQGCIAFRPLPRPAVHVEVRTQTPEQLTDARRRLARGGRTSGSQSTGRRLLLQRLGAEFPGEVPAEQDGEQSSRENQTQPRPAHLTPGRHSETPPPLPHPHTSGVIIILVHQGQNTCVWLRLLGLRGLLPPPPAKSEGNRLPEIT
ncbi:hypothetical protein CCH79_00017246 [Gambusia affinis]|uniref:EF-hand domain-containing protein n=1 Tax=Gambusia affinis TaxID=33528 RepID=A0A315WHS5_GAMAF|nr:hypothetical protein CCH79_00017246 [Gambusia affinis]